MSVQPVLPILNEDLFVPDVIEFNMANNATQPFYTFVDHNTWSKTRTITHLEFGRAAHRAAHIMRPNFDAGADGTVVALVMQADTILYTAIVAGLIVAGYVPFPMSPRNTPGAIVELLTKTSCHRLLTTYTHLKSLIDSIKLYIADTPLANKLRIEEIPSMASVYPYLAHETANHPFDRYRLAIQRPSRRDPCLYLHSSGSTGNPKPIPQNQVYWAQLSYPIAPTRIADLRCSNPRFTLGGMSLPSFHTYGLAIQLFMPIYGVLSVTVFPPNSVLPEPLPPIVPSPENILEHMKLTKSSAIETFASFVQVWALIPEAVEYLKTLRFVGWAGGPLAPKQGNLLSKAGVTLRPLYGGTEFGINTRFTPLALDDPEDWEYMQFHEHMNIRWMPQGDGSYECQFLSHEKHETMLNNLPDVPGYATSDLWRPHPTKKGLWKIVGRIDDVIVHSSGEKTVPAPMEAVVVSDPLYDNVETAIGEDSCPISWSLKDIEAWLLEQASDLVSGRVISPVADLFEQGFDSLYATSLRLRIANALRLSEDSMNQEVAKDLSPNLVYSHPKIRDLAAFIFSLLTASGVKEYDLTSRRAAAMEAMIAKYSSGFESPLLGAPQSSVVSPAVVLLTGSTGHLGSQILAMLLKDPRVGRIYTYNRPSNTKTLFQRHLDKFEEVGLDIELLNSEKLVLISGDAAEIKLGLDQDLSACHFIELVRLGSHSLNSRFLFISSIAAVQNWDKSKGAVPEDVIEDVYVALGGGYGEGKHIVERVRPTGFVTAGILSFRLDSFEEWLASSVDQSWSDKWWTPEGVSLGAMPNVSGVASWLGADTISATIVDLALSQYSASLPRALNLVHPRPVRQSVIMMNIKKAIADILGHDLRLVPSSQWFSILEKRAENATAGTWGDIPAVKLLEFFRGYANADTSDFPIQSEAGGFPSLSTETVQRISEYMSPEKLQQIGEDDAKLWVSFWHSIGFLY
ncbi:hypothetical protein C0993_011571 [Termitomyces sp. T159_Od127]|nr:hypothetical protein C0993_011571 [Termitomyces sp. T159_Od127]